MVKIIIATAVLSMFNLFGFAQDKETEMTISELKKDMKENSNLIILDVRTPGELASPLGHIEGVINIPLQELDSRMNELQQYKDKDIAVICRTGNRSGTAAKMLRTTGYKAKNVLGGMVEYNK